MTDRIRLLQALRLKGRVTAEDVAPAAGLNPDAATSVLADLAAAGLVESVRDRRKLTADGRAELDALLAEERKGVDQAAITAAYHEFDEHNRAFKELVTRWQLRDDTTPNDHTDPAYDAVVIAELAALHARFRPVLDRFVALAPRLGHYPQRFAAALERIEAGEHSWFARPLVDSYHTVWFELHEDLIGLAGLSRTAEAAAGRAS
jgi:DNA-binding MarR family transcriptional regulator